MLCNGLCCGYLMFIFCYVILLGHAVIFSTMLSCNRRYETVVMSRCHCSLYCSIVTVSTLSQHSVSIFCLNILSQYSISYYTVSKVLFLAISPVLYVFHFVSPLSLLSLSCYLPHLFSSQPFSLSFPFSIR